MDEETAARYRRHTAKKRIEEARRVRVWVKNGVGFGPCIIEP